MPAHKKILFGQRGPVDLKGNELQERDLTGRSYAMRAQTVNEQARTVEAVLATENPVLVMDFRNWQLVREILVMDGLREIPAQLPLLDSHARYSVKDQLGSTRNIQVKDGQLVGVRHLGSKQDSRDAFDLIREGHLTDGSIGYRVSGFTDIEPGESSVINGREYTNDFAEPLRISYAWGLIEDSLTPIGADQAAKMRDDHQPIHQQGGRTATKGTTMDYSAWLRSQGIDQTALTEARSAILKKIYDTNREAAGEGKDPAPLTENERALLDVKAPVQTPANDPEADPDGADGGRAANVVPGPGSQAAVLSETDRINEIRSLAEFAGIEIDSDVVRSAITQGLSPSDFRARAAGTVRQSQQRSEPVGTQAPAGHVPDREGERTVDVMVNAMRMRAGMEIAIPESGPERQAAERSLELADRYRDLSLVDLCREAVRLDGGGKDMPIRTEQVIQRALSGGTLQSIFTNTAGAVLLDAYQEASDTTAPWTTESEVSDFKTNERAQYGGSGNLTKHARGGEADHDDAIDKAETVKVNRFSKQFTVDEMDLIDDRFDVLVDRPRDFGDAAQRLVQDLVYYVLMSNPNMADGTAIFDASRNNLISGAGSALAQDQIQVLIQQMMKMKGLRQEQNLNIMPTNLIVPPSLMHLGAELINSSEMRDTTANTVRGTMNTLRMHGLKLITESRLENGVTDPDTGSVVAGSATAFFLTGNTRQAKTIEKQFLRGTGRRPSIRSSRITSGGRWGIEFDVKHDAGARALDFRGLQKSAGA